MVRVNLPKKNIGYAGTKSVKQKIKDGDLLKRYYRIPADLVKQLNIAAAVEGVTNEQFVISAIQSRVNKKA